MYNIKFSIDKEQMIFLVKKAVLFRYTIVKDSGDEIVVGTPPSYLTTVTIKAQSVEFQGNIAISNSCSAVIKRELAKYEAKQNKLAKKEAKEKEQAEQPEEKKPEVKDAAVAERLELAVLLERYKQLLDSGAISEEDYEKRKQEILAMMEFEKKEEEQPAPEVREEPKEEPKEEVVPAPVVVEEVQPAPVAVAQPVQQQPQVVIINNQAPAPAAAPVEEKKPKEKCPTLYKVFAILFGIILLAGGAALLVFYFFLPKLTIDPAGANVENANGLGAIAELFSKKYTMSTELSNTMLKDKFTISGLIAGGIAGVAAILGALFTLISIKPKEGGKIFLNAITLILGGGSVIYLIMNKTMNVIFLVVGGVTAFVGLVLIILAFVKPKEK